MTTPVEADDVVQGVVKYLQSQPAVVATLGTFEGTTSPWLFQRRMWAEIEGSSSTACMLYSDGGWTSANNHNTLRFPRLSMEIWADPLRDSQNNVTNPAEVWRRINRTYHIIDSYLHRPQGGTVYWGTVRTVDCVRLAEPTSYEVPDGDGTIRLMVSYAVTEG